MQLPVLPTQMYSYGYVVILAAAFSKEEEWETLADSLVLACVSGYDRDSRAKLVSC
jgi:hypothetical protein